MAQAASEAEQAAAAPAAVANATPLGMFAFGTSVIILSCVNAGIIVPKSGAGLGIEAGMALFYGGAFSSLEPGTTLLVPSSPPLPPSGLPLASCCCQARA